MGNKLREAMAAGQYKKAESMRRSK